MQVFSEISDGVENESTSIRLVIPADWVCDWDNEGQKQVNMDKETAADLAQMLTKAVAAQDE